MSETLSRKRKAIKTEPKIVKVYDDGSILLDYIRVSYPWVGKPQKNVNEKTGVETESFAVQAMVPKDTHMEAMKACRNAIRALEAEQTTKGKGRAGKPFKYQSSKKFIKDADAVDEDGEPRYFPKNPEYAGHWIVSTRSPNPPILRGPRNDPETGKPQRLTAAEATRMIYPGCFASVLIRPWPQDNQYGVRVNAELLAIQFKRKGDPLGNAKRLDDDDIDDTFDADDDDVDTGGFDDEDDDM